MVSIQKLLFAYPKGRSVLNNIDLKLEAGNIYGLFGMNGEGKSTLMKIVAGLLVPQAGSVQILGNQPIKRNAENLQHIFLVPEEFELPSLKIHTFEAVNSPFYPRFSRNQFYNLIEEFKLVPNANINTLSFGQKKKVLIAFGIATNTSILLMDEPTNGLDIPSKSQFRKIMASATDEGKCIVISTHQVRDLHSLINHVVILEQSAVIFDESLNAVSELLWFGRPSKDAEPSILYSEGTFGGKAVLKKEQRDETEIDLELLFNAVLHAPEPIAALFKKQQYDSAV